MKMFGFSLLLAIVVVTGSKADEDAYLCSVLAGVNKETLTNDELARAQAAGRLISRLDRLVDGSDATTRSQDLAQQATGAAASFRAFRLSLRSRVLERDYAIDAILSALLNRKNVLLVGGAGTGKSFLSRLALENIVFPQAIAKNFASSPVQARRDAMRAYDPAGSADWSTSVFKRQLGPETLITDIVGSTDIPLYFSRGTRRLRLEDGALNHVFAFMDEFFDAPATLIRSLFELLNERTYSDGNTYQGVIQTVIAATNLTLEDAYARAAQAQVPLESAFDRFSRIVYTPKKFENRGDAADPARRFGSSVAMMQQHLQAASREPVSQLNYLDLRKLQDLVATVEVSPYVLSMVVKVGEKMDAILTDRQNRAAAEYTAALSEGRIPPPPYRKTKEFSQRMYNFAAEDLRASIVMDWVLKDGQRPLRASFKDIALLLPFLTLDGPAPRELDVIIGLTNDLKEKASLNSIKIEREAFNRSFSEVISEFEAEIARQR